MATSGDFATDGTAGLSQTDRPPIDTPLHAPGEMALATGVLPLRQECWDSLNGEVRDRLHELSGTVIDWWAALTDTSDRDSPIKAVVFGEGGLFVVEPVGPSDPSYLRSVGDHFLYGYTIVSGSLTTDIVDHTPSPEGSWPQATSGADASGVSKADEASEARGPLVRGLTPRDREVLGNLPPRAQMLLQAPFVGGEPIDECEFHYEGYPHHFTAFVLYLVGGTDLTVASGEKLIPDGHSDATAHWSLKIHRALIVPWLDDDD